MDAQPVGRDQFQIAIICALPLEADAVYLLFDEFFPNKYHKAAGDPNHYTNGRIGKHDVVLVLLPGMGKVHAASAAASLKATYTNLRLALLVGVCGGVPGPDDEMLLGDVVISSALVQVDLGRRYPRGVFLRKTSVQDSLGRLSKDLRCLLRSLETSRYREDMELRTAELLRDLQAAYAKRARNRRNLDKYEYPGSVHDELFKADYQHQHRGPHITCCSEKRTCETALKASCQECGCDKAHLVSREYLDLKRNDPVKFRDPAIFVGPVASGDTVMKSGEDRDRIAKEEGVIGFEMEGAGVWDEIPCIVIKGVCDYSDSHKNKRWQQYAAATAAATTKALLEALIGTDKGQEGKFTLPIWLLVQMLTKALATRSHTTPAKYHVTSRPAAGINLFIHCLKSWFKDLGTRKIDRGEWFLEDQRTGRRLDLSKPWQSNIKPNQVLKMSMVFRRRNESCTNCPSCGIAGPEFSTDEIQCRVCLLTYRRVEEIQRIQIDENRKPGAKSTAIAHPPRPKQPRQPSPEDEIGRYKHIQLVDVDFKIDRANKIKQPINTMLLLSCQDLRDAERLAEELASVYGLPEQDSLALADKAISSFQNLGRFSSVDFGAEDMIPGFDAVPMSAEPTVEAFGIGLRTSIAPTICSTPGYHIRFTPLQIERLASRDDFPEPAFQVTTRTFKNSVWNRAHYGNSDFSPEEWAPEDEDRGGGRIGSRRRKKRELC
ncbi:hypothetical protein ACJZ2D_009476 [Fusarium nematophilum]